MNALARAGIAASTSVAACAIILAAASLLAASSLPAQEWRTLQARRTRPAQSSTDTLHVRVNYSAGKLTLHAAAEPLLYDLRMRFDANLRRAKYRYDSSASTLTVGGDSGVTNVLSLGRRHGDSRASAEHPYLVLGVAAGVPLDLTLDLSASEAAIDLGNLDMKRLRIETAASDNRLVFGTPNPSRIPSIELHATAAGLTVAQLGNAHTDTVRASATMGHLDLDLSGEWAGTGEVVLDLRAVMGAVTVRVPNEIGVRVTGSRVLGSIDNPGFIERGGSFYTDNWDSAARKLVINGRAVMARIEVIRIR